MKAQREPNGKWKIQYRYTDYQGNAIKSTKRGFDTKREAEAWLREFLLTKQGDFNMRFEDFVKLYYEDMDKRLRENTIRTKKYIIDLKILPYFGKMRVNKIKPTDIRKWQNTLLAQNYSLTYIKTIQNQLTCLCNYAVRFYDLKANPCLKAGSIGSKNAQEMKFWVKQEFMQFIDSIMDKRQAWMGFMVLYWTGCRIGELLALTVGDIDLDKRTISISKSFQRIDSREVITPPKTPKGNRIINIPEFLAIDLQDYIGSIYGIEKEDRLFPFTKYFFEHEMQRGVKLSGVKKIRLHDLRHSHCALLIDMGFTPIAIAERLGHERIETTLGTYAHLFPNKQAQMAERLDAEYKVDL